jgi:surface protein
MGSFLDKVGLQHFVEKIKGLLSGYLPLSGGTMTGDIVYTDKATLNGEQLNYISSSSKALEESILRPIELVMTCKGNHDTYGAMQLGVSHLDVGGLSLQINDKRASLNIEECKTTKFELSEDSHAGLIANNSETVVKELSDEQVDKLLAGDTSTISDSKYYVSGANLGRFAQNVAKDNSHTIIKTNGIVKITTSKGEVAISAGINYHIYEDYKITNGKNYVSDLIQSGYAQNGNKYFDGLSNLSSIDVSKLNISNIKDLSFYFRGCSSLYNLNIEYWDTKEVKNFAGMFTGCRSLMELRLYFWDTRNVSAMSTMFAGCTNLKTLNLSGWNTQSVNIMSNMFSGCSAITSLYLSENFGRMGGNVSTLDLSALIKWADNSVQTLLKLYDRKANGMGVITIKLSAATKSALGTNGIQTLTAKGYTIA